MTFDTSDLFSIHSRRNIASGFQVCFILYVWINVANLLLDSFHLLSVLLERVNHETSCDFRGSRPVGYFVHVGEHFAVRIDMVDAFVQMI